MSMSMPIPADSMVNVEIEAAEALADLAYFAMRESSGGCQGKWRSKKRKEKVKSEVLKLDMGDDNDKDKDKDNCPLASIPIFLDLEHQIVEDSVTVSKQRLEEGCGNKLAKPSNSDCEPTKKRVKADREVESVKPRTITYSTNYPLFGCRRQRRELTEAEKEERRMRRILANRESARQTIRRRQALCEELTKKAADLAWENENLKKEKELALKEYHSLETTNKKLKEQVSQAVKPKVEEIQGNDRSQHFQMPPLPTNYPLFVYSRPAFTSYIWPSAVQSLNPYQSVHDLHNIVIIPSSIHLPANSVSLSASSHEQANFTNINGPRTPFCVVPSSWFLPHHDRRSQLNPHNISFSMQNNLEEVYLNSQSGVYSPKVAHTESRYSSLLSVEEKKGAPDLNETSNSKYYNQDKVGVVVNGFDTDERTQVRKMRLPARLECLAPTMIVKQDNGSEDDNSPCAFPEKKHEPVILLNKKIMDSVAAAEARKRRKEVTKLKNLYGRQYR